MKVFLIAGEVSGDKLGGALMAGLQSLEQTVSFEGVGGPLMQSHGLESQFPMEELSLMGISEILPKYFHLKRRIRETADAIIAAEPDVLITIDSPDFCLRVAKLVKEKSDIPTVHYVAPTVWAWRAGRARKMSRYIDHVLALFPFEPPFMQEAGMTCDFVGHPIVGEKVATDSEAHQFRTDLEIGDAPLCLVLPGSRRGEVARLSETFSAVLERVSAKHPKARFALPCAAPVEKLVREITENWTVKPILISAHEHAAKRAAFKAANFALAASGTVSLELAAAETPMVIAYDMSWLSRQIISRMLRVDTVTLVNLVSDTRVVPEFIGANCQPEPIAEALSSVLDDPTSQFAAMRTTMQRLGLGGEAPGLRAARSVLQVVNT